MFSPSLTHHQLGRQQFDMGNVGIVGLPSYPGGGRTAFKLERRFAGCLETSQHRSGLPKHQTIHSQKEA